MLPLVGVSPFFFPDMFVVLLVFLYVVVLVMVGIPGGDGAT